VRRRLLLIYLAALHAVLAALVVKTNFLLLAGKTLGWLPAENAAEPLVPQILDHAQRDRSVPPGATLLLGDSIIAGLDQRLVAPGAVNFGAGGDTIRTLRVRLLALRSIDAAAVAVLGVGINDLKYRSAPEIVADYEGLLRALPPALPLIIVSVLPINERMSEVRRRRYLRNEYIRPINAGMKRLCDQRPGCRFLDVWPTMAEATEGGLRASLHGPDGLHLSAAGNKVLSGLIAAALRQRGSAATGETPPHSRIKDL
jgi:lysophospholipase L1-like esterase